MFRPRRPTIALSAVIALVALTAGTASAAPRVVTMPSAAAGSRPAQMAVTGRTGPVRASDLTSRVRAAAGTEPDLPTDPVGPQSSSIVAPSHDLLVGGTLSGGSNDVFRHWSQSNAAQTELTDGPSATYAVRPDLRPEFGSVPARPMNPLADRVLSLRLGDAGSQNLLELGTSDDNAEADWVDANQAGVVPQIGTTVQPLLVSSGIGISAGYGPFGADAVPAKDSSDVRPMQWSVVDAGDGSVSLVNREDGLCLNNVGGTSTPGAHIGTWPCPRATSVVEEASEWKFVKYTGSDAAYAGNTYYLQQAASGLAVTWDSGRDGHFPVLLQQPLGSDDAHQLFQFTQINQPGGTVPTYSFPGYGVESPAAVASGDLDRAVDTSGSYHDEAVVAYVDDEHKLQMDLVDYNRNASRLSRTQLLTLFQAPAIVGEPGPDGQGWIPGSVGAAIGDFDGDQLNEVALTWQNATGFYVRLVRYDVTGAFPVLRADPPQLLMANTVPGLGTLEINGLADTVGADLTGDGTTDLAVALAGYAQSPSTAVPALRVATFGADGKINATAYKALTTETTGTGILQDNHWQARGITVHAGLFRYAPTSGAILHRRQLAVTYPLYSGDDVVTGLSGAEVNRAGDGTLSISLLQGSSTTIDTSPRGPASLTQPVTVAAGAFSGPGDGGTIATWGIAVTYPHSSDSTALPEYFLKIFRPSDGSSATQTYSESLGSPDDATVTAYDRTGRTVLLGPPVVLSTSQLTKPSLLAAQPPAHADWLGDDFVNVSRTSKFTVTYGTSTSSEISTSHTSKAGTAVGVAEGADAKATVTEGLAGIERLSGSVELTQKFSKDWDSDHSDYTKYGQTREYSESQVGTDDDIVNAWLTPYTIYRYPVLGETPTTDDGQPLTTDSCPRDCHAYYEVIIPGTPTLVHGQGRAMSWYEPTWQNGNALSYTPMVAGLVPTPDLGSYQILDKDTGKSINVNEPLFNVPNTLGGSEADFDLSMADSVGSGNDRTSSGGESNEFGAKVSLSAEVGIGVAKGDVEASVDGSYDNKSTWATADTSDNVTTSGSTFKLNVPPVVQTRGYGVGTTYYTSTQGVPKIVHGVDLTSNSEGKYWWQQNYGQKPDLALDLPDASTTVKGPLGEFDDIKWVTTPARQKIRGFTALHGPDSADGIAAGVPYASNPQPGDTVQFSVRVNNYSLKGAPAATAKFWAVPTSPDGLFTAGDPVSIGTSNTPVLGPQQQSSVLSPTWTTPAPATGQQNWRIVVVLDPDNAVDEIHPWQAAEDADAATCPADSLDDPTAKLLDTLTGQPETLACGQNNQGFGELTVSAASGLQGSSKPASVELSGGQIGDGTGLQGPHGTPTLTLDKTYNGVVRAQTDQSTDQHSRVLVFDGPVSGGNLIADTVVRGADARDGGYGRYLWQPTTIGHHVIHQLLIRADGTTSEHQFAVNVTGKVATLKLTPATSRKNRNQPQTYAVTAYDSAGRRLGTVTSGSILTISGGGSCLRSSCRSTVVGRHVVTARYGTARGTAVLIVTQSKPVPPPRKVQP